MRILMTTDAVGGVWSYSIELARGLSRRGFEISIATMGERPSEDQRLEAADVPGLSLVESDFRLEWMEAPWDDVRRAGDWLLELEKSLAPDVVHVNGFAHAALPFRAPVLLVGHSDVLSWWEAVHGDAPPARLDRYRREIVAGLGAADRVVAPSRWMLGRLAALAGALPDARVIGNGRSPSEYAPADKEPFVLAAGRLWDEGKNVGALSLAAGDVSWPILVAGAEGEGSGTPAGTGVRPLGRLSARDLARCYARAAIFAHPARYEPFGLAPLEAALSGCVLVLGDIPSLREIWGDAAFFVDPRDPRQIASALDSLIADPAARETLAARGRARALGMTAERMCGRYEECYRTLRRRSTAPRLSFVERRTPDTDHRPLSIVFFVHSLVSDWNHGNAHFLRGVGSELLSRGHRVRFFEPRGGWSASNLVEEHGREPIAMFHAAYPQLSGEEYDLASLDLDRALEGADLVLVHEWSDPALVRRIGEHRARSRSYRLLFHDTHHRAATDPAAMEQFDLSHYDGVLAFGRVIRDLYLERGWAARAWTWHEAADPRVFRPYPGLPKDGDLVWIGNWGDGERTAELSEFVLGPVADLGLSARVYGVRYPEEGRNALARAGIGYAGWLANSEVPRVFARYRVTVHVPRRPYREALPGIPTIRPFEALACGIPLVCAPWDDAEGLFTPGEDFLVAENGRRMRECLRAVLSDSDLAEQLARHGLDTIRERHSCSHRVDELLRILADLERGEEREALRA